MYNGEEPAGRVVGRSEVLARFPSLSAALWTEADRSFPVRVTRSFLARIRAAEDPLARQVLPSAEELVPRESDRPDPVGDRLRRPLPWVVRKHEDRVLLLLTRRCHLYCRYCFRRDDPGPEDPSPAELEAALRYIEGSGAREVILSGGDPLAVRDERLFAVIDRLRGVVPRIRLHTRAPVTAPFRVTDALVGALAARAPLWVVIHCNHADELSLDVRQAVGRMVDAGLPVLCQTVLLRGVNDRVEVLEALSEALLRLRVLPYYLHHPDPVPGAGPIQVELERGLALHRELARRVSGMGLPRYVIDPPDGSGKVEVERFVRASGRPPVG